MKSNSSVPHLRSRKMPWKSGLQRRFVVPERYQQIKLRRLIQAAFASFVHRKREVHNLQLISAI